MAGAPEAPPEGFSRIDRGPVVAVVEPSVVGAVDRAGLLDPGGLSHALSSAAGPTGRARVAVLALEGRSERLCLRPLRRGGWLARWLPHSPAAATRAIREIDVTARLRFAGAPVPRPLCVIADRSDGGCSVAVGTVFEEGAADAVQILDAMPSRRELLAAAAAAGRAVRRFHDAGGVHADLHVKNLLLRQKEGTTEAIVIDLDRARLRSAVTPRERIAELMRLYRSLRKRGLLDRVGRRGCARFFSAYVAGDRTLRRALRRGLAWERVVLAVHSLHYR